MKKLILNAMLLFAVGILSSMSAIGQIMPPLQNSFAVYPLNPTPKDTVYVAYSYTSNDGCPDFKLVKDSVVKNRIYIAKKGVDNPSMVCTQVISYFSAKLKLGALPEKTEIYFEGRLIQTIKSACIMDLLGEVVAYKDSSAIVKDISTGDIYAIKNSKLPNGTQLKFKGIKIQCFTTPCYNIVECYEVISVPPPTNCVMDKKGVVVAGTEGCAGQLFIQEISPISSSRQLYIIKANSLNANGTTTIGLKVNDKVLFGGYLIKSDSSMNVSCRAVGVATCYQVTETPPVCVKDLLGEVVAYKDSSAIIKETLKGDIYAIKNLKLPVGTQIKFKGIKIQCVTTPCYNIVECYEIVSTPPPCVMDKKGVVVAGTEGCVGQLFIQEISPISSSRQLYIIKANSLNANGTTTIGLKVNDKVLFGGYLIKSDSSMSVSCRAVGVATCYQVTETPPVCVKDLLGEVVAYKDSSTIVKETLKGDIYAIKNLKLAIGTKLKFKGIKIQCITTPCYNIVECYEVISTPPPPCAMDKKGVVVAGTEGCVGQLFIQEISPISSSRQLYIIKGNVISSTGVVSIGLKLNDKVIFGGYLIKSDSSMSVSCRAVGVATCYQVTETPPVCVKDLLGEVVAYKDSSTIVKETLKGDIYAIKNLKLAIGTKLKFKGIKIQCITTPCYNIVECYEVISTPPPPPCVMDKVGVVVAGIDGCTGRLFIQEESPISTYPQLYTFKNVAILNNDATKPIQYGLKVGDKVKFAAYMTKNDSTMSILCYTVGVATCYEVISTPPPTCVMDKVGEVVAGIDGCTGKLFIQEASPISAYKQLFSIENMEVIPYNNDSIVYNNSTRYIGLKVGDKVKFGGYYTKNDSNLISLCHTVGVATCYEVIGTPPPTCNMDKVGVVVAGVDGCTGSLFVQEESSISSERRLYSINDIAVTNVDATMSFGLKVGTKVKFAAHIYLSRNDSNVNIQCNTIGAVTCWEVISTPPPPACVMNKVGVVVAGVNGCAGRLFIEDTSYLGMNMIRQLYTIDNITTSNDVVSKQLKAGDIVRFGGYYTTKNDTSLNALCYTVGVATCYELVKAESTYLLAGSAVAGNDLLKSGYAVLIQKGHYKAAASSVIVDGKFIFTNLPNAEYTVYVIPDIRIYKNYLPTFYSNKLMFKKADYVALNSNIEDLVVNLRQFVLPVGTGKIYGNIFFETYSLKDSILNKDESQNNSAMNTIAFNTPVVLYNSVNEPIAWTLTDLLGNYVFENIALETYKVVSETAAAIAESVVVLTAGNSTMNADLLLKSQLVDTGVNTIEDNVIELYPNPVIDNLKINLKEAAIVDVYNVLGKILIHAELQSGDNVLDLSQIAKGIYYTKIGKSSFKIVKK